MDRSILRGVALTFGTVLVLWTTTGRSASRAPSQTAVVKFAHLRVYRPRRVTGSALAPSVYVDDREVARVGNGRRISIRLSPGPHNIRSDDKSSAVSIAAEASEEYFVRVDEEVGFWKGHGKLTLILPEQGRAEFKLQRPVEDDRRIAKNLIEDDAIATEGSEPVPQTSAPEVSGENATPIRVSLTSMPSGADIEIDGSFVGNTPSSVELTTGDHSVVIKKAGYNTWERKLKVMNGDIKLNADLEKQNMPQ